ncbi:MAG: DMT family transporter, partial [Paludibacteraceae bacterium]|nr:DMT family transporter [Paludibacteraceae bacterium]
LAFFSSIMAFVLYCYAVRLIGVTQANAFNNARPIFTALIMLTIFGEHLPLGKWLGIALVVIGLFVCQKREKQHLCKQ